MVWLNITKLDWSHKGYGADYNETFCTVVTLESLHALITLSVQYGLKLYQIDIITAFLNGELQEVYIK